MDFPTTVCAVIKTSVGDSSRQSQRLGTVLGLGGKKKGAGLVLVPPTKDPARTMYEVKPEDDNRVCIRCVGYCCCAAAPRWCSIKLAAHAAWLLTHSFGAPSQLMLHKSKNKADVRCWYVSSDILSVNARFWPFFCAAPHPYWWNAPKRNYKDFKTRLQI